MKKLTMTFKKLIMMIVHLFTKTLEKHTSDPTLNTEIAIKQGKTDLKSFFSDLTEMEVEIKKNEKTIDELTKGIEEQVMLMNAAKKVDNRDDVMIALKRKKSLEIELEIAKKAQIRDREICSQLKADYATAKDRIDTTERSLKSLKARKKGQEIRRKLLKSGKDLLFPDSDENMFSLEALEDDVNNTDIKMEVESNLVSELRGEDIKSKYAKASNDEALQAELEKFMNE